MEFQAKTQVIFHVKFKSKCFQLNRAPDGRGDHGGGAGRARATQVPPLSEGLPQAVRSREAHAQMPLKNLENNEDENHMLIQA